MAISSPLPLQSRFSNSSVLSLPVNDDEREYRNVEMSCSPFSLSCAAINKRSTFLPQRVSSLTLDSARYDASSSSTTYQHGQITPTSPQLSMVKTDKTPFPPPLPSTWTWSPDNSSCLASLPPTRSEDGPSNWYGSTLQSPEELLRWQRRHSSVSKPLLSPIKFSPDVHARSAGQVEELPHPDFFDEIGLDLSHDDVNSFHSSDWDLTAPSRRLSYGEPLDMIEARSIRKSTGSTDDAGNNGWSARDKSCDTWVDDTIKAQAGRACHSEPSRRKNRLWLDLIEDDEEVSEAVGVPDQIRLQTLRSIQHATAVSTSPSKPRVISIRPRRATTEMSPAKISPPSLGNFQPGVTTYLPETPPRSPTLPSEGLKRSETLPDDFAIERNDLGKQERQQQAFNRIRSRTTWSTSPQKSDVSLPWSSETVRRVVTLSPNAPASPTISRPATPPPASVNTGLKLSELTTWILTELEAAVEDNGANLKLDSLVIHQLRLPPKQRRIPHQPPLVPARSSFSAVQGPLSSHSSPSQFAAPPSEAGDSPIMRTMSGTTDTTLAILGRIFPLASQSSMSRLLATIIAQQFVSTIHPPLLQQTAITTATTVTSPFAARHISKHSPATATTLAAAQTNGLPEHIPSKARAMLGLPPLSPPGKSKSSSKSEGGGSRPPLPSFWRKVEKMEWKHRVGKLDAKLQQSVKQIVRELVGGDDGWRSGERWFDVLISAVGESVKLGEATMAATAGVGLAL